MAFTIMPADAQSRRRLLILTGIAMIAAAGLFFSSREDTPAVPAAAPPPAAVAIPQTVAPAVPADTEIAATALNNPFRDPFRPPPGYSRQVLAAAPPVLPAYTPSYGNSGSSYRPPAGSGGDVPKPAAASLPASLVGIVAYNGERAAIINYGGQSRSYRTNDSVGPYRLSQIREDSVVLSGGGGTQVLRMRK